MADPQLREKVKSLLGIPSGRCDLAPESRGSVERDGIVIEKWIITAETGSRIPLNLYRPKDISAPIPAIVQTCGHGGSKGIPHYTYTGQLYARMGIACLNADPIGEEERHPEGRQGTREHDQPEVTERSEAAGRSIMGKFIFDAMRCLDFLETLDWIDKTKFGVAGNSLGGAVASWLFKLEPRLAMTIVSGWALSDFLLALSKDCTALPIQKMRGILSWKEFLRLPAGPGPLLIMNGDDDPVIDQDNSGTVWKDTIRLIKDCDPENERMQTWFCPGGGHRPYQTYKDALLFINQHLGTRMATEAIQDLPELNYGDWCDKYEIELEELYGTEQHQRGAMLPDLGIKPIPREELAVLEYNEIGNPDFTISGWLDNKE